MTKPDRPAGSPAKPERESRKTPARRDPASSEIRNLHLYRYGEARGLPGLSIGVARQAPRGVRREDQMSHGYFDVRLPLLAPSAGLVAEYRGKKIAFPAFARRYRAEMRRPEPGHTIRLLAALTGKLRLNLGCFCEDETCCHRSVLRALITEAAKEDTVPDATGPSLRPAP